MDLPSAPAAPLQRKRGPGDANAEQASTAPSGGGQPLPGGVRTRMEASFGADFSAVRVHEGARASAMGALGYTQGTDLHFAPGQYQPETQSGQELLGHELAHVVQQRAGRVDAPQGKGTPVNADPSLEREADEAGVLAARGERAALAGSSSTAVRGGAIQRKLIRDNPDGAKPAIAMTTIEQFAQVPNGTSMFEDTSQNMVRYLGINRVEWSTVYIELEGKMHIYRLTDEKVLPYQSGAPEAVAMKAKRLVNGEPLSGANGTHCGVLYEFEVLWKKPDQHTGNGVAITEVITVVENTGWFAGASERKQDLHCTTSPGETLDDFIGISTPKKTGEMGSTELQTNDRESEKATESSSGTFRAVQHFEFVDDTGARRPIPKSGFLLEKTMREGQFIVQRTSHAHGGVEGGVLDNSEPFVITIKFS
jgi:hypothetical protein